MLLMRIVCWVGDLPAGDEELPEGIISEGMLREGQWHLRFKVVLIEMGRQIQRSVHFPPAVCSMNIIRRQGFTLKKPVWLYSKHCGFLWETEFQIPVMDLWDKRQTIMFTLKRSLCPIMLSHSQFSCGPHFPASRVLEQSLFPEENITNQDTRQQVQLAIVVGSEVDYYDLWLGLSIHPQYIPRGTSLLLRSKK